MIKKKILVILFILLSSMILISCADITSKDDSKNSSGLEQFINKEKILKEIPKNVKITINNHVYDIDIANAEETIKNIAEKNHLKYFIYIDQSDIKSIKDKDYLLVFSKEECIVCKYYKTVLFTLMQSSNVPVYIIDVDKNSDVISKYNLVKAPTTLVYKYGKEVSRIEGFVDLAKLKSLLN